jgi:hypothetical protein
MIAPVGTHFGSGTFFTASGLRTPSITAAFMANLLARAIWLGSTMLYPAEHE